MSWRIANLQDFRTQSLTKTPNQKTKVPDILFCNVKSLTRSTAVRWIIHHVVRVLLRELISLFLYLSLSLSLSPPISFTLLVFTSSLRLCLYFSLSTSISISATVSLFLSLYPPSLTHSLSPLLSTPPPPRPFPNRAPSN